MPIDPNIALSIRPPQDPLESYGKALAIKGMMQNQQFQQGQQQFQQGQIQEQQLQIQSQKAIQKAYLDAGGDIQKAAPLAVQYGADPKAVQSLLSADLEHRKSLATLDKDKLDAAQKTNELIGQASQALLQVQDPNQRQQLYQTQVAPALAKAGIDPNQIPPQVPDDATLQLHALAATKTNEQIDNIRLQKQQNLEAQKFAASQDPNNPVNKVTEAQLAQRAAGGDPDAEKALQRLDQSKRQSKTVVNVNAGGPGLTDTATDQAAERYAQTGVLPPTGRSIAGMAQNRKIMNRAAELYPAGSITENSAEYKANADSLKKLQTNFDQVSAFESTAKKNIDLLQQTAKNIPDLGSRFANVPVRMLNAKMIGSDNMAAFNTALNTAQTEAAKVLNSSNATGVLSDSARHELQQIIDGNLPYSAMVASLNTLKQDMANRHQAYQDQISDIRGRIGHKGTSPSQSKDFGDAGGKPEGATGTLPDGTKVVVKGGRVIAQ